MKFLLFYFFLFNSFLICPATNIDSFFHIYPKPEAEHVNPNTFLLLKVKDSININDVKFSVMADKSGAHRGKLSFYKNTITYTPEAPFAFDDRINVRILSADTQDTLLDYSFYTKKSAFHIQNPTGHMQDMPLPRQQSPPTYGDVTVINGVSVPSDFPKIDVLTNTGQTAAGLLFFGLRESYFIIMKNDGTPWFYEKSNDFLMDFRIQANGMLSRTVNNNDTGEHFYAIMDSSYTYVDTFMVKGGEGTNHHDFLLLPDGHTLYITNDFRKVDMSQLVEDGQVDATIMGNNIQEQDENGNVIFHWSCWDHLDIEDAVHEDLTADFIDYTHTNSVAVDYDGHILISNRNLSECTKINRQTHEIIWRLGGEHNMFTFINTDQNSYQHMFRPVPGKPDHYTMYDNGNQRNPAYTRAVEFKIDTSMMTVEKVWEYRKDPDYHAAWLGGAFRLPNGNTLINWGMENLPFATEVDELGNIVYEAHCPDNIASYRSYRYPWNGVAKKPYLIVESLPEKVNLIFNKFGDHSIAEYIIQTSFDTQTWFNFDTTGSTFTEYRSLENDKTHYFRVQAIDSSGNKSPFSNIAEVFVHYSVPGENFLENGSFDAGENGWNLGVYGSANATSKVNTQGKYYIDISNPGDQNWHVQLTQTDVPLIKGRKYLFEFDAYSDTKRIFDGKVERNGSPYTNYSKIGLSELTQVQKHYAFEFTMQDPTDYKARVVFNCGKYSGDVYIDNVSLKEVDETAIENEVTSLPGRFQLYQNYPNPFNATTQIRYTLDQKSFVRLSVFDLNGRRVARLIDREQSRGSWSVNFDANSLSSGIYFYVLHISDKNSSRKIRQIKKMILCK